MDVASFMQLYSKLLILHCCSQWHWPAFYIHLNSRSYIRRLPTCHITHVCAKHLRLQVSFFHRAGSLSNNLLIQLSHFPTSPFSSPSNTHLHTQRYVTDNPDSDFSKGRQLADPDLKYITGPQDSEMQMFVLYFEWILLFSVLTVSDSLTEPADKEKLLGCLCYSRNVTSSKIRILTWIHNTFSQCTVSTAWITSLHTLTGQTPLLQLQEKTMSNQRGVKAFLKPYPVLLDRVHGHLFLGGCCLSLSTSIQVIERISDHYRLAQTTTKCSRKHPFWLERYLCEGASVNLEIQGIGALTLTHHLLASDSVSSLYKWERLSLFFLLKGLGRNQHCLYFFLSMQHVNTLAQLAKLCWFSQHFLQFVTHSLPWGPTAEPTTRNTNWKIWHPYPEDITNEKYRY